MLAEIDHENGLLDGPSSAITGIPGIANFQSHPLSARFKSTHQQQRNKQPPPPLALWRCYPLLLIIIRNHSVSLLLQPPFVLHRRLLFTAVIIFN